MNLKNVIAAIALVATTTLVLVYTGDRYPQTFFSADLVDVTGDGVPELVVLDSGTLDQTDEQATRGSSRPRALCTSSNRRRPGLELTPASPAASRLGGNQTAGGVRPRTFHTGH